MSFIWQENRGRTFSLGYLTSGGASPGSVAGLCFKKVGGGSTTSHYQPLANNICGNCIETVDYPMNLGTLIFHIKLHLRTIQALIHTLELGHPAGGLHFLMPIWA